MKYVDEFRDGELARNIATNIAREAKPNVTYRLMEFCGGHTHAISRYGIADLLPSNVRMIHGPGCPVCVLPIGRVDQAIRLALEQKVILCTYADTMRVPASNELTLMRAKAAGADVRMIYSTQDALKIARDNPLREVVFFAIGFETTTPPTAVAVKQAAVEGLNNFSILCNHVLTPAAMHAILAVEGGIQLDGFVGPAHVSTVIGSQPYEVFADDYRKPVVIAGFEPLDVMQSILMLVRQINDGRSAVENEFTRAVTPEGNRKAQALVAEVFQLRDSFEWRGLGSVPNSALKLRPEFAKFDAELRFDIDYVAVPDHKACECAAILRGEKRPQECKIFGTVCTPQNPVGSCMVSSEGACAAHYTYGRLRKDA
ncbi:MAG: hydrogenase expression/formation protein HypD [Gallionellaceae bacterium]|nr:MAG: hydrogenase expression/formation protein HypD [Gallionellaceae bacterium]